MGTWTIDYPTNQGTRTLDGDAKYHGYVEMAIPVETKKQFADRKLQEHIKNAVKRAEAAAESELDITIT